MVSFPIIRLMGAGEMGIRTLRLLMFWGAVVLGLLVAAGVWLLPPEWRAGAVVWLGLGLPILAAAVRVGVAWARASEARAKASPRVVTVAPVSLSDESRKLVKMAAFGRFFCPIARARRVAKDSEK